MTGTMVSGSGLPAIGLHVVARPSTWPGGGLAELRRLAGRAEQLGFHRIGTGDVQGNHYELFSVLGALGAGLTRIPFGAQVAQPTTRHPGVMAAGMLSIADMSASRPFWVLGRGDGAARNAGGRPMPIAQFAEYLATLRALLVGGIAQHDGATVRCAWPGPRPRVPMLIAAEGPRMIELGLAAGDGIYLGTGFQERIAAEVTARAADGFDMWWVARTAVHNDAATARESAAEDLSSAGNHALRGDYDAKDVPTELRAGLQRYHREYSYAAKASGDGETPNVRLMRAYGLEDYFAERFGIIGTPTAVRERLAGLAKAGFSRLILRVRSDDELTLIHQVLHA